MNTGVKSLPGAFPLHEDRDFLSESEWVVLKLLCRPINSLAEENPQVLSEATGGQITPERCDELIRIVRIHALPGLGSWIARLMAETGLSDHDVRTQPAEAIMQKINARAGYPICNQATVHALERLQLQWKGANV
jgi:hypothetical protein